ncbi:hypothetical protein FRC12_000104 [Ceratobasidium sp. 428]|nr:hypothetical protein FRC12_000104 [Ceratobasidium sp. 428]
MDTAELIVDPFEHSWPVQRLHASLTSHIAEGRIYGPVDRVFNDIFLLRRPHTAQGGWMLKPQPCLRECQANVEPPEMEMDEVDEGTNEEEEKEEQEGGEKEEQEEELDPNLSLDEDEDETGNVSIGNTTIDSQNNRVLPGRHLAKRPDFALAWATSSLTADINHLYVEVKTGKEPDHRFLAQMKAYLWYAVQAIPPTMTHPVYFLLLNGPKTLVWTLNRDTVIGYNVMQGAGRLHTMGEAWWALMEEIANRT